MSEDYQEDYEYETAEEYMEDNAEKEVQQEPKNRIFYTEEGTSIGTLTYDPSSNVMTTIPAGIYKPHVSMMRGVYFSKENLFERPEKMYGNIEARAKKVLAAYSDRSTSTGILLSGEKGSGKTLLLKLAANELSKTLPVINMSEVPDPEMFRKYMEYIDQDAVIVFDEFEKSYNVEQQNVILTILDGTTRHRNLFLFTCNNQHKITEFMINRPGRIYYHFKYDKLEMDFVREYIEDNLVHKKFEKDLLVVLQKSTGVNFDGLKSIVDEMNRLELSFGDIINDLNVRLAFSDFSNKYFMSIKDKKYGGLEVVKPAMVSVSESIYDNSGSIRFLEYISFDGKAIYKHYSEEDRAELSSLFKDGYRESLLNDKSELSNLRNYLVPEYEYENQMENLGRKKKPTYDEYFGQQMENEKRSYEFEDGYDSSLEFQNFTKISNLSDENREGLTLSNDRFVVEFYTKNTPRKERYLFGSSHRWDAF